MQILAKFLSKVGTDFIDDAFFRGCRKAADRRNRLILFLGKFPNETGGVEVVRPEVVTPFGKTVGLVKHPATDFALLENIADTDAAQLFRRNVQYGRIPQADSLEDLSAFRQSLESRYRFGKQRPGLFCQVVHLILHQGLQR